MKKTINISHLILLILGLLFYTSIGLLFVIADVKLRVLVFLLLLFVVPFKKQHYLLIIISCIVGFIISPFSNWQLIVSNVLSWGTLIGSLFGSLLIYEDVFSGGDFASISKFFKNKNKVAIHAYYAFKIIPMISDLLDRLSKAYMVYGKRKYIGKKKTIKFKIFIDVIDSFFNELLTIMFSQVRIMNRRECVAYSVSQEKRAVSLKMLITQILITLCVITVFVLRFLNIHLCC
jgi:hypothetical protein